MLGPNALDVSPRIGHIHVTVDVTRQPASDVSSTIGISRLVRFW